MRRVNMHKGLGNVLLAYTFVIVVPGAIVGKAFGPFSGLVFVSGAVTGMAFGLAAGRVLS
jgi:hypothetical protein